MIERFGVSLRYAPGVVVNGITLSGSLASRESGYRARRRLKEVLLSPSVSSLSTTRKSSGRQCSIVYHRPHWCTYRSAESSGDSSRLTDDGSNVEFLNRAALLASSTLALCRSRESSGSDKANKDSAHDPARNDEHQSRDKYDHTHEIDIPIHFEPSDKPRPRARRVNTHPYENVGSTLWDRFKRSNHYSRLFSTSEQERSKSTKLLGIFPIVGNISPTTFGNIFLTLCGGVFGLWLLGERGSSLWLSRFMRRHFVASRSALDMRRYHTLLTCAVSHTGLMHLLMNGAMFYTLMNTFQRNMCHPASSPWKASSFDRLLGDLYTSVENFFWGEKRHYGHRQHVQTADIVNVMLLSAVGSSLGHVLLYNSPVIGASGAISGLLYLLASTFPNSYFRTVFPIPGLELSVLQICQLFVATNLYFILTGGSWKNVAWAAHLFGMATGAAYCFAQQYVFNRPGFHNAVTLSIRSFKRQWMRTLKSKETCD